MTCEECASIVAKNSCETIFEAKLCAPCRTKSQHANARTTFGKSLWALCQRIGEQWMKEANSPLLPSDVGASSQKVYTFSCEFCSVTVVASPGNLRKAGLVQCSLCAHRSRGVKNSKPRGKTVADDEEILRLWDVEKNTIKPESIALRSNKKVYWLCSYGQSTFTTVDNRARGRRCGVCTEKFFISEPERQLQRFILETYEGLVEFNRKKYIYPYELDVILPQAKIAIEFNGVYFHSNKIIESKHAMSAKDYHLMKFERAKNSGLDLLFVWEDDWYNESEFTKRVLTEAINGIRVAPLLRRLEVSAVDEENC